MQKKKEKGKKTDTQKTTRRGDRGSLLHFFSLPKIPYSPYFSLCPVSNLLCSSMKDACIKEIQEGQHSQMSCFLPSKMPFFLQSLPLFTVYCLLFLTHVSAGSCSSSLHSIQAYMLWFNLTFYLFFLNWFILFRTGYFIIKFFKPLYFFLTFLCLKK